MFASLTGQDIRGAVAADLLPENDMAVCSVLGLRQQLRGQADDILPGFGLYDYTAGASRLDEYAECLGIGNICPQAADSLDGLEVTVTDADTVAAESQESVSNQTIRPVIYPWMQRRRHRNGNIV